MLKKNFPNFLLIMKQYPQFTFVKHAVFHWSPRENNVYYVEERMNQESGLYQFFHEIGHALSNHVDYSTGIQLLKIETEAWERAQLEAQSYGITIKKSHIEHCLDSYRDWLHLRSLCPTCQTVSIESGKNQYRCFNCRQNWKVSKDQTTRSYRLRITGEIYP